MSLKDAQHKLSTDISTLYETYLLISKNRQYFNELDVALLQQHLLHIYHSLLKVQSQLGTLPNVEELGLPLSSSQVPAPDPHHGEEPGDLFSVPGIPEAQPAKEEAEAPEQPELVPPVKEPVAETPPAPPREEPVQEPEPADAVTETPADPATDIPEPTLDDLEKLTREQEARDEEAAAKTVPAESPAPEAQPSAPAGKDESSLSLLDKLTANIRTSDVYEKIAREQLSLKQAINLNKKIAFVNNLFNENTVEYAKAIERLNSASGLHEALRHFSELKHQYNWNNENPLVRDLEQLIEKRYS